MKNRKFKQALENHNKEIERSISEAAECYNNRGVMHYENGYFEQAVEDYKKAIELDPSKYFFYLNLANAYHIRGDYRRGDFDQAIKNYEKAIKVKPKELDLSIELDLVKSLNNAYQERDRFSKASHIKKQEPESATSAQVSSQETTNIFPSVENFGTKTIGDASHLRLIVGKIQLLQPPITLSPEQPESPEQELYKDDPELAEFKQAQKKLEIDVQKTTDIKKLYNRWAANTGIEPEVFGNQLKAILPEIPKDATAWFSRKKNAVGTKYVEIRWEREIKVGDDTKTESYEFSIGKLDAKEQLDLHEDIATALSAGKSWSESLRQRKSRLPRIK